MYLTGMFVLIPVLRMALSFEVDGQGKQKRMWKKTG